MIRKKRSLKLKKNKQSVYVIYYEIHYNLQKLNLQKLNLQHLFGNIKLFYFNSKIDLKFDSVGGKLFIKIINLN